MKNSNETIGNRTRDLPTCNAVPQTNALPRAPQYTVEEHNLMLCVHPYVLRSNQVQGITYLGCYLDRKEFLTNFH